VATNSKGWLHQPAIKRSFHRYARSVTYATQAITEKIFTPKTFQASTVYTSITANISQQQKLLRISLIRRMHRCGKTERQSGYFWVQKDNNSFSVCDTKI